MSDATEIKAGIDSKQLRAPFGNDDIEWRLQQAGAGKSGNLWGLAVPYITNRAIQQRLDEVCGIDGWKNEYTSTPNEKGTLCGVSIKFGDEWITKWDGAEDTDTEAVKGGLSQAMKRAAVQWGIGRYLYKYEAAIITLQLGRPEKMDGWIMSQAKIEGKKQRVFYRRPQLPKEQ